MNKEFFQRTWGEDGYYENFSYGVGIDKVCEVALSPFFDSNNNIAIEIGSGGGVFTERMVDNFWLVIAIDVIKMPEKFKAFKNLEYIELPDDTYKCILIDNHADFCFSYNLFCHLSNEHIKEYVSDVHRVLKPGADFVFMLANYKHTKKHLHREYNLGELTTVGHYVQNERTLDLIINKDQWEVVSPNMIPEHRDIIVHLKKK